MRQKCSLVLSNGKKFQGKLIGAPLSASGELVFTTGMVGYSEALTDPSYFGQILLFSYPLIGNYGIPPVPEKLGDVIPQGFESNCVHAAAVLLTVDSPEAFHWQSFESLDKWLKKQGVPGVVGLDTRHLVSMARSEEGLLAKVEPESPEGHRFLGGLDSAQDANAEGFFDPVEHNVVAEVSNKKPITLGKGKYKIALLDFGVKWNIIRQLLENDCTVEVLPWDTDVRKVQCDGWLLSNGPGDPKNTGAVIEQVQILLKGNKPVFGICLGYQLMALAAGAETKRMTYGHRSHNQPVYQIGTRKGYMTTQNHGFEVDGKTLPDGWSVWFRNVNDQSVEGIKSGKSSVKGVQFHPESAGGPRDTSWLLKDFINEVEKSCQY